MRFQRLIPSSNSLKLIPGFADSVKACAEEYDHLWKKVRIRSAALGQNTDLTIVDDTAQPVGAFKLRGATVAVRQAIKRCPGESVEICAASSGSFGMSIGWAAREVQQRSKIFMPNNAPDNKKAILSDLGAMIDDTQASYEAAKVKAHRYVQKNSSSEKVLIDGVGWEVFWGNGSIGLEIHEKLVDKTGKIILIVPLGIGSLAVPIAQMLAGLGLNFDLAVVQPETHSILQPPRAGSTGPTFNCTLADGAAVKEIPAFNRKMLLNCATFAVALEENEICAGVRYLWDEHGIVSEGAGALAIGALLAGPEKFKSYDHLVVFVTGNNIEKSVFKQIVAANRLHLNHK